MSGAMATVFLYALMVFPVTAVNVVDEGQLTANPIRKVVTMLQNMQAKVAEEAAKEKVLYDKFMCYCKTSGGALSESIAAAETAAPALSSEIDEAISKKAQLESDLKADTVSRAEAKEAIEKATAIREKEAATYAKESSDYKTNIAALKSAISAISSGMSGGAFLQTKTAAIIRRLAIDAPIDSDMDRQTLMAFLDRRHTSGYAPQSGEIVGILKTIEDEMSQSLADITSDETSAVKSYEELIAAKKKEIATLQAAIEKNNQLVGDLAVEIEMKKGDLSDTEAALRKDQEFLKSLETDCESKKKEWSEIEAMRAEEQVALAETIKVLNEDDALELFKKTLPSASLLQTEQSNAAVREKVLAILIKAKHANQIVGPELNFVELALKGKGGFEKVIKMIDDMVALLAKEQTDDDAKKGYCEKQIDEVEDNIKSLAQGIADLETVIDEKTGSIATLKDEIKSVAVSIKALDKTVEEATEQRKADHAEFLELISTNSEAKEILAWAKNRLHKFYNPTLYKAAPKVELEEKPASFVQVSLHHADEPPPPPAAPKAYSKLSGDSSMVIKMIDTLVKDLDKEMQTAEVDEKSAQESYEGTMADAAAKRAEDKKLMDGKISMKAQLEGELGTSKEDLASKTKEKAAAAEFLSSVHTDCDFLLKYYDVRKEARAGEVESLKSAKAILSGADFSFLQSQDRRGLRR